MSSVLGNCFYSFHRFTDKVIYWDTFFSEIFLSLDLKKVLEIIYYLSQGHFVHNEYHYFTILFD